MVSKKIIGFLIFLLYFAFSIPSFAKTLRIGSGATPTTFDWTQASNLTESAIFLNTQRGLYRYDQLLHKPVKDIAESLTVSSDHQEYIFKINKNAKWSDGRPVFAQDFVYSWLKVLSPSSTSSYLRYLFDIKNAQSYNERKITDSNEVGIKAIDDFTLKVTLNKSYLNWESVTTFWTFSPLRKDQVEKFGSNWSRPGVQLSTGAYTVESYETDKKLVLSKNPYGPPSASNIDKVEIYITHSFSERLADFKSNKIDVAFGVAPSELPKIKKMKELKGFPVARFTYLAPNTKRYPMSNEKFRKAIFYALKHSEFNIKGDTYQLTKTLLPLGQFHTQELLLPAFNSLLAKKALKESGVVLNSKFKLKILSIPYEPFEQLAKETEKQLKENIGINSEISTVSGSSFDTTLALGDYDILIYAWSSKLNTPIDYLTAFSNQSKSTGVFAEGAIYEQFMSTVTNSKDNAQIKKTLIKAQRFLFIDQCLMLPLLYMTDYFLVHPNVENISLNKLSSFDLRSTKIY